MSRPIFDVGQADFEEGVVEESFQRTIVVDFWAEWCGPCRTLGPILEQVVDSLGERVALARVNVDQNPELAAAYQVRGIPAVKVFRNGEVVEEFEGALPRSQVEAILKPHVPDETEDVLQEAEALLEQEDLEGASALFANALRTRPGDERAQIGLARVRLAEGDVDSAVELAGKIQEGSPHEEMGRAIRTQVDLIRRCGAAGGRDSCEKRLERAPGDLDARFDFAACCAAERDYATALKEWLGIVEESKGFRDGSAKDAMVSVFRLLGQNHRIVADYPQRLYRALY